MTDPDNDEAFDGYLKRRPVLPDAIDDTLEPPAALDHAVLNQARAAIQAGSELGSRPSRPPRWALPVALAAIILLCLSVVMNISLNANRPGPDEARLSVDSASAPANSVRSAADEAGVAGRTAVEKAPLLAKKAGTSVPRSVSALAAPAPKSVPGSASLPVGSAQGPSSRSGPGLVTAAPAPSSVVGVGTHPSDPGIWLRQIDALRAAGKTELADAEMRRFRATFPDYAMKSPLPAAGDSPK